MNNRSYYLLVYVSVLFEFSGPENVGIGGKMRFLAVIESSIVDVLYIFSQFCSFLDQNLGAGTNVLKTYQFMYLIVSFLSSAGQKLGV